MCIVPKKIEGKGRFYSKVGHEWRKGDLLTGR